MIVSSDLCQCICRFWSHASRLLEYLPLRRCPPLRFNQAALAPTDFDCFQALACALLRREISVRQAVQAWHERLSCIVTSEL
jgi:hypothetical protein